MRKHTESAMVASSGVRERDEEVVRHASDSGVIRFRWSLKSIYFLEHLGTVCCELAPTQFIKRSLPLPASRSLIHRSAVAQGLRLPGGCTRITGFFLDPAPG
jgi:hypothetical protein